MIYQNLACEIEGQTAVVALNRPDRRNALSTNLMLELIDCLDGIGRDARVRAIIVAAAGKVFCSGHDLTELVGRTESEYRRIFQICTDLITKVQSTSQPVIAQVQGLATAAGCQLVAACDLAIASENASFATPGVKIGLFCTTPMVALTRAVGRKRAFEMLVTDEPIDARTAAAWGLINRAVPAEELESETRRLAGRIAAASSRVIATGKRAFYAQIELDQPRAYAYANEVMVASALAGDAREGVCAFLEKRKPEWTGE